VKGREKGRKGERRGGREEGRVRRSTQLYIHLKKVMEGTECKSKNLVLNMRESWSVKPMFHTSSYTSLKIIVFQHHHTVQQSIGLHYRLIRREVTKYLAFTTNVPSLVLFFLFVFLLSFFNCDSDIDKFFNYNNKTHKLIRHRQAGHYHPYYYYYYYHYVF
jgi:hypothetical protein